MISMKCFVTDDNGFVHNSIEDLIDGDLWEIEAACMDAANGQGDFFSMKIKGGIFTIPKRRIQEVSYSIKDMGDDKDDK